MRIEISAGITGGASVTEYQLNMAGFISNVDDIISGFKAVTRKAEDLPGGAGSLRCAVDEIEQRIRQEEEKREAAVTVRKKTNDFLELAMRVDKQVAHAVNKNRNEFYKTNPWLKPALYVDGIPWYEHTWDWICGKGEKIAEGLKDGRGWIKGAAGDTWDWMKDTAGDIWDWTKDTAKKAWRGIVKVYNAALENYKNHGWVYYVWEGGKVVFTLAKACVKIAGAIMACTTVAGIPLMLLGMIDAFNDITSAAYDTAYLIVGQHEMVGKTNKLKELLINNAGQIGVMLGDESLGEKMGELIYYGIDLVDFLSGAEKLMKSFGKLDLSIYGDCKDALLDIAPRKSFVWGEVSWDDVYDNEFSGLKKLKLEEFIKMDVLKIDPTSTFGLFTDVLDGIHGVYNSGNGLMKNILKVLI